jgi:hypothetical protein
MLMAHHHHHQSDNVFVTWDGQKNPKSMHIGDFDVSKMVEKGKISFTQNVGTRTATAHTIAWIRSIYLISFIYWHTAAGFIAPEIMSQSDGSKAQAYGFEADSTLVLAALCPHTTHDTRHKTHTFGMLLIGGPPHCIDSLVVRHASVRADDHEATLPRRGAPSSLGDERAGSTSCFAGGPGRS